jgi:hypothetical protein
MTYTYRVIAGYIVTVLFPNNLQTWGGAAGTAAITWTGTGHPPPTGTTQRFTVQTFQNNAGNSGMIYVSSANAWTAYLTVASGSFTGNQANTGTIATTITYMIA